MTIKYYDSPFHVTYDNEKASKMAMKMDLSIMLTALIKEQGWTQIEAAKNLTVKQSRISDLATGKIEKFTIDAMFDMFDALGFRPRFSMPSSQEATISISKEKAA